MPQTRLARYQRLRWTPAAEPGCEVIPLCSKCSATVQFKDSIGIINLRAVTGVITRQESCASNGITRLCRLLV